MRRVGTWERGHLGIVGKGYAVVCYATHQLDITAHSR